MSTVCDADHESQVYGDQRGSGDLCVQAVHRNEASHLHFVFALEQGNLSHAFEILIPEGIAWACRSSGCSCHGCLRGIHTYTRAALTDRINSSET